MICPVLPEDVSALARALLAVPAGDRRELAREILRQAAVASRHVRQTGALHPDWGDGTLGAAARRFPLADEPQWDDHDYLNCLLLALETIRWNLHGAGQG